MGCEARIGASLPHRSTRAEPCRQSACCRQRLRRGGAAAGARPVRTGDGERTPESVRHARSSCRGQRVDDRLGCEAEYVGRWNGGRRPEGRWRRRARIRRRGGLAWGACAAPAPRARSSRLKREGTLRMRAATIRPQSLSGSIRQVSWMRIARMWLHISLPSPLRVLTRTPCLRADVRVSRFDEHRTHKAIHSGIKQRPDGGLTAMTCRYRTSSRVRIHRHSGNCGLMTWASAKVGMWTGLDRRRTAESRSDAARVACRRVKLAVHMENGSATFTELVLAGATAGRLRHQRHSRTRLRAVRAPREST